MDIKPLSEYSPQELWDYSQSLPGLEDEPILEPGEWFLHCYSSSYLVDGEIPDWALLKYRAEVLELIRLKAKDDHP